MSETPKYARVFVGADAIKSRRIPLESGVGPAKFEKMLQTNAFLEDETGARIRCAAIVTYEIIERSE